MDAFDTAERISRKLGNESVVAVFIVGGKPRLMGMSKIYAEQIAKRLADKLLGIYKAGCPFDWINEDCEWANKHMAEA